MVVKHSKTSNSQSTERERWKTRPQTGPAKSQQKDFTHLTNNSLDIDRFESETETPEFKSLKEECLMCGGKHKLRDCKKFSDLSVIERSNLVKQNICCLRCLANHFLLL